MRLEYVSTTYTHRIRLQAGSRQRAINGPAAATVKRYEDNNGTISAFLSGQVDLIATGNVVAAAILAKNPPKKPEVKFLIKDSPCFVGLNKGEAKLQDKVNAILTKAKRDGSLNQISVKWLGAPLPTSL